jgi:hypothetical protein
MRAALNRHQRRVRDRRRHIATQPVRDRSIAAPVHHNGRRADQRNDRPDIDAVDEVQQHRRRLRTGRLALETRVPFPLRITRLPEKQIRQHARDPSPQCERTVARIVACTSGAPIAAPSAYAQYKSSRSTRSG